MDDLPAPPGDLEVVLAAVALPAGRTLQATESGEPGWFFAKQGLVVRSGVMVELAVAAPAVEIARIGWSRASQPGATVRVVACPGTGWTAFVGGYTVKGPTCVPLTVRADGREASVRIGVGVPCP